MNKEVKKRWKVCYDTALFTDVGSFSGSEISKSPGIDPGNNQYKAIAPLYLLLSSMPSSEMGDCDTKTDGCMCVFVCVCGSVCMPLSTFCMYS